MNARRVAPGDPAYGSMSAQAAAGLSLRRNVAFPLQQHMFGLRSAHVVASHWRPHRQQHPRAGVSMISARSIRRFIADFRWALLGLAAMIAFALGWLGYTEYLNESY